MTKGKSTAPRGRNNTARSIVVMLLSWMVSSLITGVVIFSSTIALIWLTTPKVGQLLGVVVTILGSAIVSEIAVSDYVDAARGGNFNFWARWARSMILPFVDHSGRRYGRATVRFGRARFLAYSIWCFYWGSIIVQTVNYEVFGKQATTLRNTWGGALFGLKIGVVWAGVALAVWSGGDFWANWWGAWI